MKSKTNKYTFIHTLFGKYFLLFMLMIFISIFFLGTMLLFFTNKYFRQSQEKLLIEHARIATKIAIKNTEHGLNVASIREFFDVISDINNVDMAFINLDGDFLIASNNKNEGNFSKPINRMLIQNILNDKIYKSITKLDGIYKNPHYVVMVPVIDKSGICYGIIMTSYSFGNMATFLNQFFNIFLICSLFAIIVISIIIYFTTTKITNPLKQISQTVVNFCRGDYSKTLDINGKDEVAELSMAVNDMGKYLSVNEELRRSFVANVSHELKTPMTTISGFVDGILDGTIPENKRNYYLQLVSSEVKRLSRVVVSMLNISKIEAGQMTIKETSFDIIELILNVLLSFDKKIEDKKISIEWLTTEKQLVIGDRDLIYQVVYNLLDNAIKFTDNGERIILNIYDNNDDKFISIKNTGKGIESKQIYKIFDRFYKVDKSRSIDKEGFGLGLYIVKTIINMHNSKVFVNSENNEYFEVVFSLKDAKKVKI